MAAGPDIVAQINSLLQVPSDVSRRSTNGNPAQSSAGPDLGRSLPAVGHGLDPKKLEEAMTPDFLASMRDVLHTPVPEEASLRTPVNNIEYFPPNFEGLVPGCIDADFCE